MTATAPEGGTTASSGGAVLGLILGLAGAAIIWLYVVINHRVRARGRGAHWLAGWLLALPGMTAMGAGWALLSLAGPRLAIPGGRVAGVLLLALAALTYAASAARVGRWRRPSRYTLALDTSGIYSWVRHPQALALCLAALGLGAATGSVPFLLTLPLWLAFWTAYTYLEERLELLPTFGEEYRRYSLRTPRLFPLKLGARDHGTTAATTREEAR